VRADGRCAVCDRVILPPGFDGGGDGGGEPMGVRVARKMAA
jgi:hypothetical protein